jgi:hypothetical protein
LLLGRQIYPVHPVNPVKFLPFDCMVPAKTEAINAIKGLSEEQQQHARQIQAQIETMEAELQAILRESAKQSTIVDLPSRNIDEPQAADLRARFSEDWDRPETSIYDQPPAR